MSDYRIENGNERGLDLVGPDGEPILLGQTKPDIADWLEANAPGTSIDVAAGIIFEGEAEGVKVATVINALRA